MHQTKKGHQWYFGLKAHLGVDADSGLAHSLTVTAANVSDISEAHKLLHGEERVVFDDAGYIGVENRPEIVKDHGHVQFETAAKRGKIKAMAEGRLKEALLELERVKASVRAKVEHCFQVVKNLFRHRKVRYRGLTKNLAQLQTLFALANLVIAKRALRHPAGCKMKSAPPTAARKWPPQALAAALARRKISGAAAERSVFPQVEGTPLENFRLKPAPRSPGSLFSASLR